jgi:hypothetical protein
MNREIFLISGHAVGLVLSGYLALATFMRSDWWFDYIVMTALFMFVSTTFSYHCKVIKDRIKREIKEIE